MLSTSCSKGDSDGTQEESCSPWENEAQNGLPKEVVDSSALDNFRTQLDKLLDHSVWTVLWPKKVGPDP